MSHWLHLLLSIRCQGLSPSLPLLYAIQRASLIFTLLFSLTLAAEAQTTTSSPFTITSSTGTKVGLTQAVVGRLRGSSDWQTFTEFTKLVAITGRAKDAANRGQTLSRVDYLTLANQMGNFLAQREPAKATFINREFADKERYMLNIASALVDTLPAGGVLDSALIGFQKLEVNTLENSIDPRRKALADLDFAERRSQALDVAARQIGEAFEVAQNDPEFAAAANVIFTNLVQCGTACSYADFKALFPAALPDLPPAAADGSISINSADLLAQARTTIDGTRTATSFDLLDLKQISDYQLGNFFPADPASNPAAQQGTNPDPAVRQQQRQLALDAASASINTISQLIGFSNPKVAHQIQAVGGSTVRIGEAVNNYLGQASTLTAVAKGFAAAEMTANVIGAALDIFSLFGGGEGAPDQSVLQEIQALSQQLADLQTLMLNRFDRVDASLSNILNVLNQNFGQINFQLGVLQGDVDAIRTSLLDLHAQLDRLQQYLLAWTTSLSRQQLILAMNSCLNYRARTGTDMTFDQYLICENAFYTWAHNTASDELWAGLLVPDCSDAAIFSTLQNNPLPVLSNYVSAFPSCNLGLPPFSTVRLANPDEWILGARAYHQLAAEWPQYAVQINSSRVADLIQIGLDLLQASQNASAITGSVPLTGNRAVPAAIAAKYNDARNGLNTALQAVVDNYINDPANRITDPVTGLHLNLSVSARQQGGTWLPPLTNMTQCSGTGPALAVPANLMPFVPQLYTFSQGYLNSGQIDMCIDQLQWTNERTVASPNLCPAADILPLKDSCVGVPNGGFGLKGLPLYDYKPYDLKTFARIMVVVKVRFTGVPILSATAISDLDTLEREDGYSCSGPPFLPCNTLPAIPVTMLTDIVSAAAQNWESGLSLKAKLDGSPQVSQEPQPQLIDGIVAHIDTLLRQHQQKIYSQMSAAFDGVGLVQTAGQRLTQCKLLLQAYVNFGLLSRLESNDYFWSLIYGDQSILDAAAVQADLAVYSTSGIFDTTFNKLADEMAAIDFRSHALSTTFNEIFSDIERAQMPEPVPAIDVVLQDLAAFQTVKDAGALSPCTVDLTPPSVSIDAGGQTGTIAVHAFSTCAWTATSNMVGVSFSGNGPGSSTASWAVAANPSPLARDIVAIIGDQVFVLTQAGNTGSGVNPRPVLSSLTPVGATAGDAPLTITVTGSNLVPGVAVLFNHTPRPTTFISTTQLQAVLTASDLAAAGTAAISVLNPPPNSGESDVLTFVVNPIPVPASLGIIAPANGQTLSGLVIVSTTHVGNFTNVQFMLGNANLGLPLNAPPFFTSWDTRLVPNGPYTLSAQAQSDTGTTITSAGISVTVNNVVPDTTPPTVALLSPADKSLIGGTVTLVATATDETAVVGVKFAIDDVDIGKEIMSPPYKTVVDSTSYDNGPHVLTATARDTAGNVGTQSEVVTVDNSAMLSFSPSPGSSATMTVDPGGLAIYKIQATILQGSGSTVSFGCLAPLPPSTSCSVNPSLTKLGSRPLEITITVATTAHSTASSAVADSRPLAPPWPVGYGVNVGLAAILLCGAITVRSSTRHRRLRALGACAVLLIAFVVAGCGGGGNVPETITPPIAAGTPSGTYQIVLNTARVDGTSQTFNLTLIVK
jgi:Bacterial Ig domain